MIENAFRKAPKAIGELCALAKAIPTLRLLVGGEQPGNPKFRPGKNPPPIAADPMGIEGIEFGVIMGQRP